MKVSEELPVGAVSRERNGIKMRMLKNFQKNGMMLSEQSSHIIYIQDHAIKIVDQKMYDGYKW